MKIHKLKLNAKYYEDSERGIKTFEIRKNDRDYKIGDVLELREYIEDIRGLGCYTGNVHWKIITYILDDDLYLAPGYVCLGLSPIAEPGQEDRRMSDDLISRKALIAELEKFCGKQRYLIPENVWELIKTAYTAFDKEKVMDELQNAADLNIGDGLWHVELRDALEIVEKGGIE